jgi:hypothetical protein
MKIVINTPTRAVMGWNIDVSVQADSGEKIVQVEIRINDFPDVRDTLGDPVDSWEQTLMQKGVFPGDNKIVVVVQSDAGKETRAERKWQ